MSERSLLQKTRTLLSRVVRKEMNLLYTEPPQSTSRGVDGGLFCREHAYTAYLLGRANALPIELRLGHYFVWHPSRVAIVTLDSGDDHAWCSVDQVSPVDMSMTFRYVDGLPDLDRPILGLGQYGPYRVTYESDESEFRRYMARHAAESPATGSIGYLEVERIAAHPYDILERPNDFLLPPATGARSIADELGSDIFAKIVVHLGEVARGRVQPLHKTRQSARTVNARGYPNAMDRLREKLRESGSEASGDAD